MKRLLLLLIASTALWLCMAAQGDTVYRWVDAQGNVHYTQTPPPGSKTKAKAVDITPPPPDQTSLQQTQDMEQAVNDRKVLQDANDAKTADEAKKKAHQQEVCERARKLVQRYDEVNRVRHKDKDGNVVYSSGDDLVKLRQQAQEQADKLCKGGGG